MKFVNYFQLCVIIWEISEILLTFRQLKIKRKSPLKYTDKDTRLNTSKKTQMPEYEILEDKTLITLLWRATINHKEILFIVLQSSNNDFEKALIHYAALSHFQWEVLFLRSK